MSDRLVGCGCGRKGTEEYILQCKSFFLDDFSKSELVASIVVTAMHAGQSRQTGQAGRPAGRAWAAELELRHTPLWKEMHRAPLFTFPAAHEAN